MKRPGGELATRPLHFVWIADSSGSMETDGKIQALNYAIRNAIPDMRKVADENPNAQVLVRAIKFSNGAQWHVSQPTDVADFEWTDLKAGGVTDMGKALSMVADQLKIPPMTDRALPPVLVLISDGQPTDNFESGLEALMDQAWGKKAVRIAIAIGADPAITAGAVISGSYFGDKMSPLSDTTNLAPAVAGTDLFTHIKYMVYTTVPSMTITLIIFLIMGFTINTGITATHVNEVQQAIKQTFNINIWLFSVPVILFIVIIVLSRVS